MRNIRNDITEITVLGTGSSSHQMVSMILERFMEKAGINYELKDDQDVASFLRQSLVSVPSIHIGDKYLPIDSNGKFSISLRKAIKHILSKHNYGNMDKIIIPVDFSDVSTNAFMYGHRLATDIGAVVKALHVYMPNSREMIESTGVNVDFKAFRKDQLEEFVTEVDRDWTSDIMATAIVESEFRSGFPGEEILDSIKENDAEMIIMGTTGDSGALKKWFGSVSTKVMNESTCPVLLVPENARYKGVNNILYAYDDIDLDKHLIGQLVDFSEKYGAELHFVHVNDQEHPDPGYYLKELVQKQYPKNKIKISSSYSENVVEAIEKYASANSIDVIAMGTKSRSFFDNIFHDSITQKMALQSEIPLLILKQVN